MIPRVLLIDDHAVVRAGVRALLVAAGGFEVVGEAGSVREGLRMAVELKPSVAVIDLGLPDGSGVELATRIRVAAPSVGLVALTMNGDDATIAAAVRAGVRGYVLKGSDPDELVRAIRAVSRGEALFGSDLADRALANAMAPQSGSSPFPLLTAREREVLTLIAQGRGNSAIAAQLGVSAKTVGNHVTSIFHKLHVATRPEAIVAAREAGIGVRRDGAGADG